MSLYCILLILSVVIVIFASMAVTTVTYCMGKEENKYIPYDPPENARCDDALIGRRLGGMMYNVKFYGS
jgi:hypothetical protein